MTGPKTVVEYRVTWDFGGVAQHQPLAKRNDLNHARRWLRQVREKWDQDDAVLEQRMVTTTDWEEVPE